MTNWIGNVPARMRSEGGFTLLEMLVTLALLGFAATLVGQGVWSAGRVESRASGDGAANDQISAARLIVTRKIEGLRALARTDSVNPIVDATGDASSFTFFAPAFDADQPAPLQRYRLLVTAAGDLTLLTANGLDDRFDFERSSLAGWRPITLLTGVKAFSIAYFGPSMGGGPGRWQTQWTKRPQPPELVRINIVFAEPDLRNWPDLIIRPRATVNTACRIDALSGRCEAFL